MFSAHVLGIITESSFDGISCRESDVVNFMVISDQSWSRLINFILEYNGCCAMATNSMLAFSVGGLTWCNDGIQLIYGGQWAGSSAKYRPQVCAQTKINAHAYFIRVRCFANEICLLTYISVRLSCVCESICACAFMCVCTYTCACACTCVHVYV